MAESQVHSGSCKCGSVQLAAEGDPLVVTVCRCNSCRQAGQLLGTLPGATPLLDAEGGTPFVLYRKDRLQCTQGEAHLAEHRLRAESPTRRVVATCCNTAMFLDFTKGHWVSIYQDRIAVDPATLRKRTGLLVPRLLWAWASMGFRAPAIGYVRTKLRLPRPEGAAGAQSTT